MAALNDEHGGPLRTFCLPVYRSLHREEDRPAVSYIETCRVCRGSFEAERITARTYSNFCRSRLYRITRAERDRLAADLLARAS